MRKTILLAVVAAVSLAVLALLIAPAGSRTPHPGIPAFTLADGTSPFPMCGGIPCTPGMITPAPVLADGSSPIPLCGPVPCPPQISRAESEMVTVGGTSADSSCGPNPCTGQPASGAGPTLADGTGPYPLCWPNPCTPQISNLVVPEITAWHGRLLQRRVSAG
jgi:hypothetical protein